MKILILMTSIRGKETGSTEGQKLSVKNSVLLQHRVKNIMPERNKQLKESI